MPPTMNFNEFGDTPEEAIEESYQSFLIKHKELNKIFEIIGEL